MGPRESPLSPEWGYIPYSNGLTRENGETRKSRKEGECICKADDGKL